MFIASIIVFALAVVWLTLALLGRRVAIAPACARCGFDLAGHAGALAAPNSPAPCPECGASLRAAKAVRTSRRRRRPWLVAPLALVVLLSAAGVGLGVTTRASGAAVDRASPAWLLAWRVSNDPTARAESAWAELRARDQRGALSPRAQFAMRQSLLRRLHDPAATWPAGMQDHLWQDYAGGLLTPEQAAKYEDGLAMNVRIDVRTKVRAGVGVPTEVPFGPFRVGPSTLLHTNGMPYRVGPIEIVATPRAGGEPISFTPLGGHRPPDYRAHSYQARGGSSITHLYSLPPASTPGRYDMVLSTTLDLPVDAEPGSPVRRTVPITRRATFEVLPDDARTVRLDRDAPPLARDTGAIEVLGVVVAEDLSTFVAAPDGSFVKPTLASPRFRLTPDLPAGTWDIWMAPARSTPDAALPPVRIATIRHSGLQHSSWPTQGHPLGPGPWDDFRRRRTPTLAGHERHEWKNFPPLADFRVDLTLRPNLDDAERSVDILRLWPSEIVFRDVPVLMTGSIGAALSYSSADPGSPPDEVRVLTDEELAAPYPPPP